MSIISRLESNVWRIRVRERTRPSYLERYGLIEKLPEGEEVQNIPGISFECMWDGWAEERRAFEKQFFDIIHQMLREFNNLRDFVHIFGYVVYCNKA